MADRKPFVSCEVVRRAVSVGTLHHDVEHCNSCHEDADEFDQYLLIIETRKGSVEVCCAVAAAYNAAKELALRPLPE